MRVYLCVCVCMCVFTTVVNCEISMTWSGFIICNLRTYLIENIMILCSALYAKRCYWHTVWRACASSHFILIMMDLSWIYCHYCHCSSLYISAVPGQQTPNCSCFQHYATQICNPHFSANDKRKVLKYVYNNERRQKKGRG